MILNLLAYFTLVAAEISLVKSKRHDVPPGIEARIEEAPFVVSIQSKTVTDNCPNNAVSCEIWKHICTGTIVGDRQVLTVPSCFFQTVVDERSNEKIVERDPHDILVLAGSDRSDSGRRMAISQFCYHKEYNASLPGDNYAIIFLQDYFKFGNRMKKAKSPKRSTKHFEKELQAIIAGKKYGNVYGWDMVHNTENKRLLMTHIRIVEPSECRSSPQTRTINASQHICGIVKEQDGLGDVGSPLVIDNVVWGIYITSGEQKTLFARMDTALNWKQVVAAQSDIMFHSFFNFHNYKTILFVFFALHIINNMNYYHYVSFVLEVCID